MCEVCGNEFEPDPLSKEMTCFYHGNTSGSTHELSRRIKYLTIITLPLTQ